MNVVFSSYKPRVKCNQHPAPPWQSTVNIFADMDASKGLAVFGRNGAPGVAVGLPFRVKAGKSVFRELTITCLN